MKVSYLFPCTPNRLQPDNPALPPIIVPPDRQVQIVGRVVGLYRSLL